VAAAKSLPWWNFSVGTPNFFVSPERKSRLASWLNRNPPPCQIPPPFHTCRIASRISIVFYYRYSTIYRSRPQIFGGPSAQSQSLARRVPHLVSPDNDVQLPRKPGGGSHRTECTPSYAFISAPGIYTGLILWCSVSRIKKIIQLDEDIAQCSHNATFLIAIATVSFIKKHCFFAKFLANIFSGIIHTIHSRARVQRCQIRTKTPKDHPI
jgi:hypothetical protein